jgi:hypothetical protein
MSFSLADRSAPGMAAARGLHLPPMSLREVERFLDFLLRCRGLPAMLTDYNGPLCSVNGPRLAGPGVEAGTPPDCHSASGQG